MSCTVMFGNTGQCLPSLFFSLPSFLSPIQIARPFHASGWVGDSRKRRGKEPLLLGEQTRLLAQAQTEIWGKMVMRKSKAVPTTLQGSRKTWRETVGSTVTCRHQQRRTDDIKYRGLCKSLQVQNPACHTIPTPKWKLRTDKGLSVSTFFKWGLNIQKESFRKNNVSYTLQFRTETGIPKDRFLKKIMLGKCAIKTFSFRGEAWAVDKSSNVIICWTWCIYLSVEIKCNCSLRQGLNLHPSLPWTVTIWPVVLFIVPSFLLKRFQCGQ